MSTKKVHRKRRHEKWRKEMEDAKKEAQKEHRKLKALPKPLRKLETYLSDYVEFMEYYDGYLDDFTGDIIPAEPVDNPLAILHKMDLNLPPPNELTDEITKLFVEKITEAFDRMYFRLSYSIIGVYTAKEAYKLLLFYINNPSEYCSGKLKPVDGNQIFVEQIDIDTDQFVIPYL